MKPYAYVTSYGADRTFALAKTCGTHAIIGHISTCLQAPDRLAFLADTDLRIILQVEQLEESLLRDPLHAPEWYPLTVAADRLRESGLNTRVDALLIYDEPFLHLTAGDFNHWPSVKGRNVMDYDLRDAFASGLSTFAAGLRTLWPVPIGAVDGAWCRPERRGAADLKGWYQPAPAGFDFLAVDAYCPSPWEPNRAKQILDRAYRETAACGRAILAVPQAFADTGELWRDMPALWQIAAQLDWLAEHPTVVGVAFFILDHPHHGQNPRNQGIAQHPELLDALRGYAAWCRAAPPKSLSLIDFQRNIDIR